MSAGRWERFCVVGLGGHARTKLIPAIEANGQSVAGIVTAKEAEGYARFDSIDAALAALPPDTAFVVASPPTAHFNQAMTLLDLGRDAIVEKPAFVTAAEAEAATEAARRSGALLIEAFMNRETITHRRFLADWAEQRPVAVHCTFTIPAAPAGTFRSDVAIGASNLYDIGSYFLSALLDAGLPLDGIELLEVDRAGLPDRERLKLAGEVEGVQVEALIGIDDAYRNVFQLTRADGSSIEYRPFFFGRPGLRTRRSSSGGEETFDDVNAFQAMFAHSRGEWRATQGERLDKMVELTRHLERLGRTLTETRARAAS